jgi:hypothetical protein
MGNRTIKYGRTGVSNDLKSLKKQLADHLQGLKPEATFNEVIEHQRKADALRWRIQSKEQNLRRVNNPHLKKTYAQEYTPIPVK